MKKILTVFLCGIVLLCLTACVNNTITNTQPIASANQSGINRDESTISNTQPTASANQSKTNSSENAITNTQPTESTNQNNTDSSENTSNNAESSESTNQNDTNNQTTAIFNTKNIKRITFYAYYGGGTGSDVPAEYLDEIITWLDSFSIDKEVPELLPPGTNTINVEFEYSDGTIVKKGLDTTTVDGVTYYIKGNSAPGCYQEIISKTSLN